MFYANERVAMEEKRHASSGFRELTGAAVAVAGRHRALRGRDDALRPVADILVLRLKRRSER